MNEKEGEPVTASDIINRMDRRKREEAKSRRLAFVMFAIGATLLCLTMLALL